MPNDLLSLAGTFVTLAGTVYLVSETGKLIRQASRPSYSRKRNTRQTEHRSNRRNYSRHTKIKIPDMGIRL